MDTCCGNQPYQCYTSDEQARWGRLLFRQVDRIQSLAAPQIVSALADLHLSSEAIPHFTDLERCTLTATGWRILAVDGLLPAPEFFWHLAHRTFPVTWWLRDAAQEDYIVEPDLFHDLVGHLPAIMVPEIADFTQAYGRAVMALTKEHEAQRALVHLYWYTVEFGLVAVPRHETVSPLHAVQAYGAGLLSSYSELLSSVTGSAEHRPADLDTMLTLDYEIDKPQPRYFVAPSLKWLLNMDEFFLVDAARRAVKGASFAIL